jgi:two-component system nitrogen regulation sensor histidine kinase NtrY
LPQARLSPQNLNQIVNESLVLYREGHKNIEFTVNLEEQMPILEMDRDQMKRVLINLLENAVAALGAQSSPSATVAITTQYDSVLRIARCIVADNGPGIPTGVRDRVFDPYFSTKDGGTGLGLAIAKRIVDDHNGFIRVFRNTPVGSRFVIELPAVATSVSMAVATSLEHDREDPPTV